MKIILSLVLALAFASAFQFGAFAQQDDLIQTINIDSLQNEIPDSLLAAIEDTIGTEPKKKSDIDTVVYASGSDSLIFFVKEKKMSIYGEAKLNYKTSEIQSANIFLDFENYNIVAEGIPKDSVSEELVGTPILKDAGEVYEGKSMKYNFKTGQGNLAAFDTELDGGFYYGEKVKKVTKDTYFIKDGRYTTCDAPDPHYYFYSPKMKVIQQEQMTAEWIWLYFGDVPFPVPLPFIVFPLQSGRRSGLITPVFGYSQSYGTYIQGLGYFWAINDYIDVNATFDYYTNGSYGLASRFRYAERYNYRGNIDGEYRNFYNGEPGDPGYSEQINWRLKVFHNQSFTPTLKLDVNLEFSSQDFLQTGTTDFNDILRNEIISNATLSKTWDESGNSATLNYNRRQTLEENNIYEVLPSFLFRKAQDYPFRKSTSDINKSWYELFGYSYTGQFQNERNKVGGDLTTNAGILNTISTDMSPKIGHFTIAPRFVLNSRLYNKYIEQSDVASSTGTDSVVTNTIDQITMVNTFDFGISSSTKFYGMFNINSLGISAIRHTVTPNITYSYQPDFSAPQWGYYGEYYKLDGTPVKYNKYQNEVFGGAPSGERQNINFSLGNNFEMKTIADPTDTTSKEQKIQLLNLTLATGYNFAADSLNFADLALTYRTQVGEYFDLQGGTTFTPYDYSSTSSKINKYLINEGKGLLRMTFLNLSVSTSLSGEKFASKDEDISETNIGEDEYGQIQEEEENVYQGLYSQNDPDFNIPWQIYLSYNYSINRRNPGDPVFYSNISGNLSVSLTENWKLDVAGSYDFIAKEFAAPQIRISRDLHCWIMNFTWNPIGTYTGFQFEIRVKAPQLQDLKITKQDQFYDTR